METITIGSKSVKACNITARFEKEELETVVNVICETPGISFKKTKKGYQLIDNSCK